MAKNWWEDSPIVKSDGNEWWKSSPIVTAEPPDTGFTGAFKGAYQGIKGEAALTAGKLGLMSIPDAQNYYEAQKKKQAEVFTPTTEGWGTAPWQKFKETLGGSLPYMAAPVVGAAVGAVAAPELAVVGLGAATLGSLAGGTAQFTGTGLARQMETGKKLEDTNLGYAVGAAIPSAALDTISLRMTPFLGQLFRKAGIEVSEKEAQELVKKNLLSTVGEYAAQGVKLAGVDGATEAGQAVFERLQAGLSLTDKSARDEYIENFIGGAVLGVTLGTTGHAASKVFAPKAGEAIAPAVAPIAPEAIADQAVIDKFNMTEEERAAAPVEEAPVAPAEAPVAEPVAEAAPVAKPVAESTEPVETPQVFTVEDPVTKSGINKDFATAEEAQAHVDTLTSNRNALVDEHQAVIDNTTANIDTLKQGLDTEVAKGNSGTAEFLAHENNINAEVSKLSNTLVQEQAEIARLEQPIQVVSTNTPTVEVTPAPAPLEGVTEPVYTPALAAKIKQLRLSLLPTLERFGLKDVGLNIVASIENGTANAHYVEQVMQIAYNARDPMGSLRHESIHALKELGAFTANEWRVLSQKAKDTWINQFISKKNQTKYEAEYQKRNETMDGFDAYLQEEAIAEAFRHFANTKPPAGLVGQLYSRLNSMFQSLGNSFKQLGYTNAEAIFQKIERGEAKPIKVEKVAPVNIVKRAKDLATKLHEGQMYGDKPYTYHLASIVKKVKDAGGSEDMIAAAWLHDTVEDTGISIDEIRKEFGDNVADLVWAVTGEGKNRKDKLASVIKKIPNVKGADIIKSADRLSNVEESGEQDKRFKMYKDEHDALSKVLGSNPIAQKLQETFAEKVVEKVEAHTGTMETNTLLNKQGKEANEEYDNIKDIDKPWAKELVKRFENIQRKVFTSLSAGTINRLASTVVGEKVRVGKSDTQAFGTFDGKASPNMRIPMSYMTEDNVEHNFTKEQAELMLVVLGANLNQEAQAASLFTPVETGADTFRIRLANKILNERDAAAFDRAIGYPVNVYQDENGHGIIDINLAGNDPFTSEEALKSAMVKVFPNAEYSFTPCKYESIYITSEKSDYSEKSYKEIINEWKKGESTGGTRNGVWQTFDVDFKPTITEIRNLATARNKEFKEFTQEARRRQEIEKKVVEPEVKAPVKVKKSVLEALWESYRHTALPFSSLSKEDVQVLAKVKDKGDEAIDRAVQKIYKAIEQAPTEAEVEAVAAQEIDTKEVAQEEVQQEEEEEPQAPKTVKKAPAQGRYNFSVVENADSDLVTEGMFGVLEDSGNYFGEFATRAQAYQFIDELAQETRRIQKIEKRAKAPKPVNQGELRSARAEIKAKVALENKAQKALDKAAAKAQKVLDKAEAKIEAKALKLRVKEAVKQAEIDVANSELGQALLRVQNADFDLDNKNQIRAFYKKLVKNNILDEGGDTQENLSDKEADANDVLNSIEGELQDAYDNALQERINEVTEEAEYQPDTEPRGRFQFKEDEEYIPQTLTEKFKRFFGNSEIVNRDGTPKQMYHATARDITIFKPKQADAIFLTDSPDFSQTFAETSEDYMVAEAKANMSEAELNSLRKKAEKISKKEGTSYADVLYELIRDTLPSGQNIMPVYVSAKNVFDFENPAHLYMFEEAGISAHDIERIKIGSWHTIEQKYVQDVIKKAGFDGFYVLEGGKKNLGVYTSNQIKSAIGNNGEFDINNPDIRYQFTEDEEFVEPSGKLDNVTYLLQDKFIDLKRVIQSLNKRGKVIADKWNTYLQEELYHGRVSTRIDFFMKRQLNPVLKQMDAAGITVVDMDNYLLARHASEANAHIANVNADPSANAGMTNDEATEYMDAIPANKRQVYERIAQQIDTMTKETRDMMVSYGLEKKGVIDSWEHAYKHYVPLMREQDESDTGSLSFGTGKGYSVKGKTTKARIGSSKSVVDVLANIALQRERIIARGEKNRVGQSLLGLVLTNPNSDFWVAVNPHIGNKNLTKELIELGLDPSVSQNLGEAPIERVPNAKTGEAQTQINPLWRKQPNVFVTRVNGEDRVVIFNMKDARAKRMAVSFSNLTTQNKAEVIKMEGEAGAYWDSLTKNVGKGTRWFASINTQYNPAFGLYNLLRDLGGATLNLQSTALKGKEFKVITNAFVALRAVYKDLRLQREGKPADSAWAKKFEEFELAGGKTGFSDLFNNSEEKALKLQEEINSFGKKGVKQTSKAVFGWLSDFNSAIENCIRVSAYDEGIKSGLSQDQSASIAKNLTVNFNRTGARTKLFTPLYAFFNASVQGTARIAETMYKDGKLTPAGKKIIAGSVILGVIQAITIAAAGFDENDPPEWVKDKNIIIPYGNKKYIAIPMPLGFNIFPSFARRVTEFAMSDEKNIGKAATSTFTMILDGFNPLGSGTAMQTALPTLLDPIAAIAENKDFSGRPIARDDMNSLMPTPGYSRAKENASSISVGIAYAINILTGGTEFQKGFISPTPDTLDYLAGQVTGGVGREAMKIGKAVSALATGEELSTSNVPVVGRMIGNANQRSAETARFYENIKRLNEHKAEIEGRAKSDQEIDAYMEKHPESALYEEAGKFYKQISDLHKAKKELKLMGADKEDIKALDDAALEYMVVVNEIVRDFKHNN